MATDAIDFSSLETAAVTDSTVETPETQVDATVGTPEVQESTETAKETTEEGKVEGKETEKPATDKSPSAKMHEALKKFREADPEGNKVMATELKNLVGRHDAFTKAFPGGVKEAQEIQSFISAAGGKEGIVNLQSVAQSALESDQHLYNGDPKLIDYIVEDLKANNKLESLGKLTTPLLDKLLEVDPKGYTKAFAPHFVQGLESSGVRGALNAVIAAFESDNKEELKKGLTGLATWYNNLLSKANEYKKAPVEDPEREAFLKEKNEFTSSKEKAFKSEVEAHLTKGDSTTVLDAMKPFFKHEFFKGFPKETLKELHSDIRSAAIKLLYADKDTKAQLLHLLNSKDRSKDKVEAFWRGKMQTASTEAAKNIITRRYPGYSKTPARGVSKAAPTTDTVKKVTPNAVPIQVASKPKWDDLDFSKDPKQVLWLTGKGYLKSSGKLVKWR